MKNKFLCLIIIPVILAGCNPNQVIEENLPDLTDIIEEIIIETNEESDVTQTPEEPEQERPRFNMFSPENVILTDNPMLENFTDSRYDMTMVLSVPALKDVFADYFLVGAAINGNSRNNASINSPELSAIKKHHFNTTVYSNLMKPSYLLDHNASLALIADGGQAAVAVNFLSCLPGLDFAYENNLGMRGHTLVWHTQTPDWFFHVDYNTSMDLVDKDTMLLRMESYIKQVLEFTDENYPGLIHSWDVVNEAVTRVPGQYDNSTGWHTRTKVGSGNDEKYTLWYKVVGPDYVEKAFEFARKYAAPGVKLFYNDYNTFDTPKTDSIVNLLEILVEKDLIDGVGMQSAFGLGWPSNLTSSFRQAIRKFSDLGLEIQITELTVRIDDEELFMAQALKYKEFFDLLLEMHVNNGGPANITVVNFFGLMDRYKFYANDRQLHWLFDANLQPKPSYYAVVQAAVESARLAELRNT
jgi:endo-1,4-beta-xylanase